MISLLKKVFGISPSVDVHDWIQKGAVIVDVRTREEYQSGHIKGSVNIPLNNLPGQLSKVSKDKLILTCCASGMRSASAKHILKSKGFEHVHNAGGWMSLKKYIK
ncbi:MAG TPA: rhodanese-like domain-containing protein [Bacteroidia bacterium]|nr:rhodanese-like domain-containing protein [Bacteroidia bacterium]